LECTLAGTKVYVSSTQTGGVVLIWLVFSKCMCSIVGVDILVLLKGIVMLYSVKLIGCCIGGGVRVWARSWKFSASQRAP